MIRGLDSVLASRKAFIDATASRDFVASGASAANGNVKSTQKQPLMQLVDKPEHGFIGLFNQGATCYLNSFIQSLYMHPPFRTAVFAFRLPPGVAPASSVAHQLQALFIRLAGGANGATSTKYLTKSFGWGMEEVFQQQDVQELFQKLFEAINASVRDQGPANNNPDEIATNNADNIRKHNSQLESALSEFHGMGESFVECQTCHTKTTRPDPFLNLCLPVRGVGSVEEALQAALQVELLEGSNAYRCSVCESKQTAKKGLTWTKLPRVLSIQLLRFDMDWNTMQRVKTTSTLTFPPSLDMKPFVTDATNPSSAAEQDYELFAILVHAGAAAAGHYYSYVLDSDTGKWLKFNDANVFYVNEEELAGIFGKLPEFANGVGEESLEKKQKAEAEAAAEVARKNLSVASVSQKASLNTSTSSFAGKKLGSPTCAGADSDDSDDDDSPLAEARRKNKLHQQGPFVDPQKHAYILMYRSCATMRTFTPAAAAENQKAQRTLVEELIAKYHPEIEKENTEFVQRFAEAKEKENRITLELHYDPLASVIHQSIAEEAKRTQNHAHESGAVPASASTVAAGADKCAVDAPPPLAPKLEATNSFITRPTDAPESSLTTSKIDVERSSTLQDIAAVVHKHLQLQSAGIPLHNMRVRSWDGLRHVGERPFSLSDQSRTPRSLKWKGLMKTLLVETRAEGAEFPIYKPKSLGINLMEVNSSSGDSLSSLLPPRHVEIDAEGTLAEMRTQLAAIVNPPTKPELLRLFLHSHGLLIELIEENRSISKLQIVKNDTIYAETIDEATAAAATASSSASDDKSESKSSGAATSPSSPIHDARIKSKTKELFENQQFIVSIQFNNPFTALSVSSSNVSETIRNIPRDSYPAWPHQSVEIDARSTLQELKNFIHAKLNAAVNGAAIGVDDFRLRLNHSGPELKEMSKKISFFGLNGFVFVEFGKPLRENEFIIRCLRYAPEKLPQQTTAQAQSEETNATPAAPPLAPPIAPASSNGPPAAPPMAPPVAPPVAPIAPPSAPPMAPPMAPPTAPPCAPPLAPPAAPAIGIPSAPPTGTPPAPAVGGGSSTPAGAASSFFLSPSDPFDLLGDIVMEESWSVADIKASIVSSFPTLKSSCESFRIREKLSNKLTKVFHSDRNLRQNCAAGTLKDFKLLVVEAVPASTPEILSDELLIYVAQWKPKEKVLLPAKEMIVKAEMKLQALQEVLSLQSGENVASSSSSSSSSSSVESESTFVPADSIGFEKPLPYQLSNPSSLTTSKFNTDWVNANSSLSNSQVFKLRDGDTLVWCDQRSNVVAQYNEYNESDDIVHSTKRGEREKQKELKIYTPQEQREMEEALKQVALFEEQERKQQQEKSAAAAANSNPAAMN